MCLVGRDQTCVSPGNQSAPVSKTSGSLLLAALSLCRLKQTAICTLRLATRPAISLESSFVKYRQNRGGVNSQNHFQLDANAIPPCTFARREVTVAEGVGVIIDSKGHLGTVVSSQRFKDEIKPMDKASEAILALQPMTFRYKHSLDPKGIPQFGLVAEQVAKVNPDLVARDEQGKPYTVRYEAVNAMLLNEFLKEHRKVEKLEAAVAQQHQDFEAAIAQLKAQVQKVSAQVEARRGAQQTLVGNP